MRRSDVLAHIEHLEHEEKYFSSIEFNAIASKIGLTIELLHKILREGLEDA